MSDNPFMKRAEKRGQAGHGTSSEKRVSKVVGSRLNPASGAMRGCKGDSVKKGFLIESKATVSDTMKVDLGWLVKIANESANKGKDPALTISFVLADGKARPMGDWVLIPAVVFAGLTE